MARIGAKRCLHDACPVALKWMPLSNAKDFRRGCRDYGFEWLGAAELAALMWISPTAITSAPIGEWATTHPPASTMPAVPGFII